MSTKTSLPRVDEDLIRNCIVIFCNESGRGRRPVQETKETRDKLTAFYTADFEPLIQKEKFDATHMSNIFTYLSKDILTMYKNNIKSHYVEYVES